MKKMATTLALFIAIFTFVFMAQHKKNELRGKWVLVSYGKKESIQKPVQFEPYKVEPTLTFEKDNEVFLKAGRGSLCKGMYKIGKKNKATEIKFENLAYAKFKLAPPYPSTEEVEQIRKITQLFESAKSFEIKKNQLTIHCEQDGVLVFEKEAEKN